MKVDRPLSPRERQVIEAASKGMSAEASAFALGITVSSVNLYLKHARWKLHAKNTTEAVVKWLKASQDAPSGPSAAPGGHP